MEENFRKIINMSEFKNFLKVLHFIMISIWGLNVLDIIKNYISFATSSIGILIEQSVQTAMALAGLIYFIVKIVNLCIKTYHTYRMNNFEIKERKIEVEKKEKEE